MSSVEPGRPHSQRRRARAAVLQVLYELDGSRHDPEAVMAAHLAETTLSAQGKAYVRKLVEGVLGRREELDSLIAQYAPNWPVAQLPSVDRNILRIAIFEIVSEGDTPTKVAINEAVEMAKVFGSDSSPKFVNGVLGSVVAAREIRV
ncbi:MAG: transcription antitermination factor NusB [SAR202 cluster bacterium]|nr:transcription antitermination factor NusB [SAR202 cluster bacterium]